MRPPGPGVGRRRGYLRRQRALPGAETVGVVNSFGMSRPSSASVNLAVQAQDSNSSASLAFTATGLPAGSSISPSGTVTVTATFVWTVT